MAVEYILERPSAEPSPAPVLDASQRAVVDHEGGPLLVLAGPGTGKTTTLVEVVVDRVENHGLSPDEILVLTFSRKAADELRARIARRLARTTSVTPAMTFHSFCYGVVREFEDPELFTSPLALLSAPEQDWRIRELVLGSLELGSIDWPEALRPALDVHGFGRELGAFLSRARGLDLEPDDVAALAARTGRPDWRAAAQFFDEYLDVLGLAHEMDYGELVHRARQIAADPVAGRSLRSRFRLVVVDEYQDTDPSQVALLQALTSDGADLVAVGDPDQSIYAFRGADVSGVWNFSTDHGSEARPAALLPLTTTRRSGQRLLAASRAVIGRLGVSGSLDQQAFEAFRNPRAVVADPGSLMVQTYASASAEAEHIAQLLRRAHLEDGLDWADMAVLVRSGVQSVPRLQRAMVAAGVPVEIAADETPLAAQPAVRVLLAAARAADQVARGESLDPERVQMLLTGPLADVDSSGLRRLARALRLEEVAEGNEPRPSGEVLAECLTQPLSLQVGGGDNRAIEAGRRAAGFATVLLRASREVAEAVAPEQVLWTLWSGSGWPRRLRAAVDRGGEGALAAHRDLDAVLALFDLAARSDERRTRTGLRSFLDDLEGQEIPGDSLADKGVRGSSVRLMTAHRSKGLEWPLVVVAGVQEGIWPNVRHRGTLLQTERLGADGAVHAPSVSALLGEERRLFYVALTRARSRLVVTAVESLADDGEQPSRFLAELRPYATTAPAPVMRRPVRPLSLRGVVAELRQIAESATSDLVRAEAARRLARVAAAEPAADPDSWWGLRDWTDNSTPVRPVDEPLELSGSAISSVLECPLQWFLTREARAEQQNSTAQGFGLVVHALAADVVTDGTLDLDALKRHVDTVWHQLGFAAVWIGRRERDEADRALERFAAWHEAERGRTVIGTEHPFEVDIPVGDDVVRLRGSMDRLEVDDHGLVHVIDFKTGRYAPRAGDLHEHPQLGAYQLAITHGAVEGQTDSGGAELVQLRIPAGAREPDQPKVQAQPAPDPEQPFFAYDQLRRVRDVVRAERFEATVGPACGHCAFVRSCPAKPEGRGIDGGGS